MVNFIFGKMELGLVCPRAQTILKSAIDQVLNKNSACSEETLSIILFVLSVSLKRFLSRFGFMAPGRDVITYFVTRQGQDYEHSHSIPCRDFSKQHGLHPFFALKRLAGLLWYPIYRMLICNINSLSTHELPCTRGMDLLWARFANRVVNLLSRVFG